MRWVSGVYSGVPKLLLAFNGTNVSGTKYGTGFAYSPDRVSWTTYTNTVGASGSGWDSNSVKDPSLLWDGSQYVLYFGGFDGTTFQIGRATAPAITGLWTKAASNPVVAKGTTGDPDELGCEFPVVVLDGSTWRMWYAGFPSTWNTTNPAGTLCYAESTDGITWTKHGTMVGLGTAGAFNDKASYPGCVIKSGSTWYVFMGGYHDYGLTQWAMRGAYVTTTNPASAAAYSAPTQLTNYTGNITTGGSTWQSNLPRAIFANPLGGYDVYSSLWFPTSGVGPEVCNLASSVDITSWNAPTTSQAVPFESWHTISAENFSIIPVP